MKSPTFSVALDEISRPPAASLRVSRTLLQMVRATLRATNSLGLAVWLQPVGGGPSTLVTLQLQGQPSSGENPVTSLQNLEERSNALFSSPVVYGGRTLGEVCLYSDSTRVHEVFPLERTRVLGQQIGLLVETARQRLLPASPLQDRIENVIAA